MSGNQSISGSLNDGSRHHEVASSLAWVAVDWGSSNMRAWALDAAGRVLAQGRNLRGMLSLTPTEYEPALKRAIGDWLPTTGAVDVLVCGMAGARQGWMEAAYLPVPVRLDDLARGAIAPPVGDPRLRVRLLPGLCQRDDGSGRAFDVMRGEETQLAGLVARDSGFSGTVCLPGTHAKWARLVAGAIVGFTTCMTGELYDLLARRSVLRHSISGDDPAEPAIREAFVAAVREICDAPATFAKRLFGIRAADVLDERLPGGEVRGALLAARLSGFTIGLELAGMRDVLPTGASIVLVGDKALCVRYTLALEALGYASEYLDGEAAALAGLKFAHRALSGSGAGRSGDCHPIPAAEK